MFRDLHERAQAPWAPVEGGKLALGIGLILLLMWLIKTAEGSFIPVLDHANLAFHEAGHPIFGIFGETLGLYGGTLGQLVFPLVFIGLFWWRRESLGFVLALGWLCENGFNIARYMADARSQVLPLVGGGEHDWFHILSRWGMLEQDMVLAGALRLVCWLGLMTAMYWLGYRYFKDSAG